MDANQISTLLSSILNFFLGLETNQVILILTFLTVVFAVRQLRWTRLEIAVPEWKIVEITKHPHTKKDREEYTVNVTIKNVGKGKAHNVEAILFQSNVKLEDLGEDEYKEDVIREERPSIGYRTIVNPGDTIKANFRIRQLDKFNDAIIRLDPDETIHGQVWLMSKQIENEYLHMRYKLERLPAETYRKIKYRLNSQEIETI